MGFLGIATPMPWEESKKYLKYVREHGVDQFLATYERLRMLDGDTLKFGDEIEYMIVKYDTVNRQPLLVLRADEVLIELNKLEEAMKDSLTLQCTWHPEYCNYMIEATPAGAYSGYDEDLVRIESNMRLRRARINSVLREDESIHSMVNFPLLGTDTNHTSPPTKPGGPISESQYLSDEVINPHPRFHTMTKNIRTRRGRNVDIRVPMFRDKNTTLAPNGVPPEIHMDCQAFGMGCCCLQVTFQARDVHESRHLYDQLAVLAPVALALTAASPIWKGFLADVDVRWNVIAASVDCRTEIEAGLKPKDPATLDPQMSGGGQHRLPKSRYSGISTYICNCGGGQNHLTATGRYNDVKLEYDQEIYDKLKGAGMDDLLSRHVAYCFVRDPLIIFKERIELDDSTETDHWENLQSTNWNSVRWKPPPPASQIGWRTEFRPMEVQLTDFENAAFTVFSVLVSRVILAFDLNLYIPISHLNDNMQRAHCRDATQTQTFWWRRHMAPPAQTDCTADKPDCCSIHAEFDSYEEMSCTEILTGKGKYFPGLIPMIMAYLDTIGMESGTRKQVNKYLEFIQLRASGDLLTAASWMRKYVTEHPEYKHDSVVTSGIAYDLLRECQDIAEGKKTCPDLLGDNIIEPLPKKSQLYTQPLTSDRKRDSAVSELISRYAERADMANKKRRLNRDILRKEEELTSLRAELTALNAIVVDTPVLGGQADGMMSPPRMAI